MGRRLVAGLRENLMLGDFSMSAFFVPPEF